MYSFSSASKICEPLPRMIKGGSPPTEPKARTGEFTPPGIMLSARCCKRRDCSTFRDVVDGIKAPTRGFNRQGCANTIAAPGQTNSSDIHFFAMILQHRLGNVESSSCPSNREGFKDGFGGSGLSLFFRRFFPPTRCPASLQVSANQADQILAQFFRRFHFVIGIHHVKADVVFENLRH